MTESAIPKHTIIRYLRNKKRIPYGVIVAVKSSVIATDSFNIGYSLCNKKDKFSKKIALEVAIGRAVLKPFVGSEKIPHDILKICPSFVERCKKYYKIA
jgi:hypothetical protein